MPATLGYWKLRGLAQPIKFLMEYTGEDYVEKVYTIGPAPEYEKPGWDHDKFNLGLDFPNLPYYIDGNIKLTQSLAILNHIARKHNLIGKTEEEIAKAEMLQCDAMDLRMGLANLCYSPDYEKMKDGFITNTAQPKLAQLSTFLGNNNWFLGVNIYSVDFFLYETLYCIRLFLPSYFDKFENLKQFLKRFESLEQIKKYMKSDKYIEKPMHAPFAAFGGK